MPLLLLTQCVSHLQGLQCRVIYKSMGYLPVASPLSSEVHKEEFWEEVLLVSRGSLLVKIVPTP